VTVEEYITDEAKLFVLDLFIEQNQDAINSLVQTKHQWHFFGRFMRLRHLLHEKECNRLAILAAYIHVNYTIPKSKVMMQFTKDMLVDFAFELMEKKELKSILDTAIPVHVLVDKDGETTIPTIQ
jgi:hypothetical protein